MACSWPDRREDRWRPNGRLDGRGLDVGAVGIERLVAQHRLQFYRDVDAALGALKEADEMLSDFGGQAIDARKGIARAIDRLIEVDPAPVEQIAGRLEALAQQVEELPLM